MKIKISAEEFIFRTRARDLVLKVDKAIQGENFNEDVRRGVSVTICRLLKELR